MHVRLGRSGYTISILRGSRISFVLVKKGAGKSKKNAAQDSVNRALLRNETLRATFAEAEQFGCQQSKEGIYVSHDTIPKRPVDH